MICCLELALSAVEVGHLRIWYQRQGLRKLTMSIRAYSTRLDRIEAKQGETEAGSLADRLMAARKRCNAGIPGRLSSPEELERDGRPMALRLARAYRRIAVGAV